MIENEKHFLSGLKIKRLRSLSQRISLNEPFVLFGKISVRSCRIWIDPILLEFSFVISEVWNEAFRFTPNPSAFSEDFRLRSDSNASYKLSIICL